VAGAEDRQGEAGLSILILKIQPVNVRDLDEPHVRKGIEEAASEVVANPKGKKPSIPLTTHVVRVHSTIVPRPAE
jgi:hypothetical protein